TFPGTVHAPSPHGRQVVVAHDPSHRPQETTYDQTEDSQGQNHGAAMFDLKSTSSTAPDRTRFVILLVGRSRFGRVIFHRRWLIGETITLRFGLCFGERCGR